MVGQGEPVGLVSHLLEQMLPARAVRQPDRLGAPGTEDQLLLFGQTGQWQVRQPRLLCGQQAHRELAAAAVDQQEIRQRPFRAGQPAAKYLPQHGVVVRPHDRLNSEALVFRPARAGRPQT